jgi:hypothetical protein
VKAGGDKMKRYFNSDNYRCTLIVLLLLTCLARIGNAQNIKVEASVGKVTLPMGDQTTLHITAHLQAKDEITFPTLPDSIGKIQIVKALKPDTSFDKDNLQAETITRNYTITSFTPGTYYIPQFTLHSKTASYTTDSLMVQFTPVAVDTTKGIYDIKQPMAVSYTWLDWLKANWPWLVIPLAAILLIVGFIYYWMRRPKKEVVIQEKAPAVPFHVIALNKLNALRDKKLWQQGEVKLYHSELTDTLREYLEQRYRIHTFEQTTDEIITSIKNTGMPADERNKLQQILAIADLVKFAKEQPLPADNEQSMDNAISFIMQTKQEPVQPANKEELPK